MNEQATDIRVREVELALTPYEFRTPLKFGGVATSACKVLDVRLRVETRGGDTEYGTGSMPLGNIWSFPSKLIPADETLAVMETLAEAIAEEVSEHDFYAHPVEIAHQLEPRWLAMADRLSAELQLPESVPKLCTLVVASPFDAAIHDAFGRVHGSHVYNCYGKEWMNRDLAGYMDDQFEGEYLDRYTLSKPKASLPLYHLVGALDALTDSDVTERLDDGLPNTLQEWIVKDGLTHLKVKLNGSDADWDIARVLSVDQSTAEVQQKTGVGEWQYSLDFNEQCPNVEYLIEVLRSIEEQNPEAFARVAYVEQPTARDLESHPENKMHEAAKLKPVVIDESLVDYESLLLARAQGYTGVALKACKGQSQALLMAAAAQKFDMFLCVQDLTCPGQSFLHSAGLAAHIGPVTAIEGNARQFCPNANVEWGMQFPKVFTVKNGMIETEGLDQVGMGA